MAASQVFFEYGGNAAFDGANRNTLAEWSFSKVDALAAPRVEAIRRTAADKVSLDLHAYMLPHMLQQYLRVPANKDKYERLYDEMPIWSSRRSKVEVDCSREENETVKKFTRAFLPSMLADMMLSHASGSVQSSFVDHIAGDILVLTDNPVVYLVPPVTPADLLGPCMMAVTSRKLYVRGEFAAHLEPLQLLALYNAMSMIQAQQLVCGPSIEVLETAIQACRLAIDRTTLLSG